MKNLLRMACMLALTGGTCAMGNEQETMQKKEITVDTLFSSPSFFQKSLRGIASMLEDGEYHELDKGVLYCCVRQKNGKVKKTVLLNPTLNVQYKGDEWKATGFLFNAAEDKLILLSDRKSVYRRSATYRVVLWTLNKDGKFVKPVELSRDGALQEVCFSPDGKKISYIRNNNLYYYEVKTGKEVAVTQDGKENEIRNGHADWVYEEEFGFTKAYDWRPDSKAIAYLKFNESALKEYDMTLWGGLYPTPYLYKYPKAGEDNSKVSLWFYDLTDSDSLAKNKPFALEADSVEYMPRIFWNPTGTELILYTLNRHQNHLRIWGVDTQYEARLIYSEHNAAYVEVHDDIYFFEDGRRFLLATEKDGYNHLYLFDPQSDKPEGLLLTPGLYDVTQLYGVDEANNRVFFQAAYTSPADRDLMCVDLDGKNIRRPALDMQLQGGCTYAYFNGKFTYMIVEHSKANNPAAYYLYHIGAKEEQLVRCLLSNSHIENTMRDRNLVKKEFLRIPVPHTGINDNPFMASRMFGTHRQEQKNEPEKSGNQRMVYLQAWVMQPAEIGTPQAEGKKYPVLMFLYGGPGSQQVMNEMRPYQTLDYMWYQMLVQQGYIVVCVDNRGTGGRGEAFKKCTYLQLGKYETQDQIAAARYMSALPYVDSARIGIWGWSYGGFMSSNCLFQGNEVFKAAMAVAPVTNWKYYDNVYTERFMRTPAENPKGYELNSPVYHAQKLRGNYLLVHGTADDNVHFQNSVDLVSALQKADKPFQFMMYPNKNHSMAGNEGSARLHLYRLMTDFILKNL